jgi:hypothetical protein
MPAASLATISLPLALSYAFAALGRNILRTYARKWRPIDSGSELRNTSQTWRPSFSIADDIAGSGRIEPASVWPIKTPIAAPAPKAIKVDVNGFSANISRDEM